MKKIISLLLMLLIALGMCGCASKSESALWHNTETEKEVLEAIGKNFGYVNADEVSLYYEFDEETGIVELSFDQPETGHYIFARMMKAEEWENIFYNMDVDFTYATEDLETMGGHFGLVTTGEEDGHPLVAGIWFDSNEKIVYGLAVLREGCNLADYAKALFNPSKVK